MAVLPGVDGIGSLWREGDVVAVVAPIMHDGIRVCLGWDIPVPRPWGTWLPWQVGVHLGDLIDGSVVPQFANGAPDGRGG